MQHPHPAFDHDDDEQEPSHSQSVENLTGLSSSKGKKHGSAATSPSALDLLIKDLRELAGLAAASGTPTSQVEFTWLCGDRLRKVVSSLHSLPQPQEAFSRLLQEVHERLGDTFIPTECMTMLELAEDFPDIDSVSSWAVHLDMGHFKLLLPIHDDQIRCLLAELCLRERWTHERLAQEISRQVPITD